MPKLENSIYTVPQMIAGASDAINRLAAIHDVMARYAPDVGFRLPPYQNYHCKDLNFFDLFGLSSLFPAFVAEDDTRGRQPVTLKFSELVTRLVDGSMTWPPHTLYTIQPDVYHFPWHENAQILQLEQRDGVTPRLRDKLDYTPQADPFDRNTAASRVVIHLRRKDICGGMLFHGAPQDVPRPPVHLAVRPLLFSDIAVQVLEAELPAGHPVDLVVSSDGFDWLRLVCRAFPDLIDRIDRIEAATLQLPVSNHLDIRSVKMVVGADSATTRQSMDAMFHADLIVTASSSFPFLPGHIGGARVLRPDLSAWPKATMLPGVP